MKILLTRDVFTPGYTLGIMTIDGKDFGYVCEDNDRGLDSTMDLATIKAIKVKAKTAIPTGEYTVKTTWSNRFKKPMPLLLDVPGFGGIRIHSGNDADDTEGCICPALARDIAKGSTSKSKPAAEWLTAEIAKCEARGEKVTMVIQRVKVG